MAGFPVVISPNGTPVVAVDEGAPLATIAINGFGTPIRIVSSGAPALVVQGYSPTPPLEPQPFTLDTGSGNGGDIGYYVTIFGDVYPEPLDGYPLIEFASRNSGYFQVAFTGDVAEQLTGWYPVIEGFNIGDLSSDWTYTENGNSTTATWTGGDTLTFEAEYSITWAKNGD